MNEECKGDKQEFIRRIKEISQETKTRAAQRVHYEQKVRNALVLSREEEKAAWQEYIDFELAQGQLKRAKLLYERGLISLDKDRHFWLAYVRFLEKQMRDPQLVRAKYDNRIKLSSGGNKYETLELLLEQSLFEEEQNQIQKARKIYETLQAEIAPDCIKTLMAFINFEKRQNNVEKVKELYFLAYTAAL